MRLKFDFVETNVYRMDIELPENVLLLYCADTAYRVRCWGRPLESHVLRIVNTFSTHFESLGRQLEV